jgi:hypothetical protein
LWFFVGTDEEFSNWQSDFTYGSVRKKGKV